MEEIVNLNNTVKVKLNEIGIERLREIHNALNESLIRNDCTDMNPWKTPLDKEGYYTTQLWSLFQDFGDMIGIAKIPPFDPIELIISARR